MELNGRFDLNLKPTQRQSYQITATQSVGTLAIIAMPVNNYLKLALMLGLWYFTFKKLTLGEFGLVLFTGIIFGVNDVLAVAGGVFTFTQPDILGLPIFEFVLWPFYLIHSYRATGIKPAAPNYNLTIVLAILFSIPFSLGLSQYWLTIVSSLSVAVLLLFFHQRDDLKIFLYMVALGFAVEWVGTNFGQWHYPEAYAGNVAYWFINLWGGVGLLLRRLALPLISVFDYLLERLLLKMLFSASI